MSRTISSTSTRRGPPIVVPDRVDGCETIACYIAQTFYNSCRNEIIKISSRNHLRKFFITSQRFWMPVELTQRSENRHFDQVLYALVNDGGVCRVKKTEDGSHIVLWSDNNFHRPRTHPRKRINVPSKKSKVDFVDHDDLNETRGPGLTMSDLEISSIEPVFEPHTPIGTPDDK